MANLVSISGNKNGFHVDNMPSFISNGQVRPIEDQILDAMAESGIEQLPGRIDIDGKIHRFSTKPNGRGKDGWYVFFGDGLAAGKFGCWREGIDQKWRADIGRELTAAEESALSAKIEKAKKERDEAKEKQHNKAAIEAQTIWENAEPAPYDHPYLLKKRISPNGSRVTKDGHLVLPLYNEYGELRSLQFINKNGDRWFLTDGEASGNFWLVGDVNTSSSIYRAEGFATACTVSHEKKAACFVAFGASNLPKVEPKLQKLYPGKKSIIAADNNLKLEKEGKENVGIKYAKQCQQEFGCDFIYPPIDGDFNDHPQFLHEDTEQQQPQKPQHRFGFLKLSELEVKPIDWVVKGFIEANTLGLIYGAPSAGKSFIGIDLACSIAANREWHGHKVKQGPVFYIAGEGHNGLARRFKAWAKHNDTPLENAPIYPSKCAIDLSDTAEVNHLIQTIHDTGEHPSVVVIDTLARNYFGDENSSRDMGQFIKNVDLIRETWGCTVLIIHHSGKDTDRGARGSTALRGAIDAEYSVIKCDDTVSMRCTKMKDAELPESKFFEIKSVELDALDEEGEQIIGAAIVTTDKPASSSEEKSFKKLSEYQDDISKAWIESGSEVSSDGLPYISRPAFIRYLMEQYGLNSEASAKKYCAPGTQGKPVCELLKAGIIEKHLHGWKVIDPALSSSMILTKKS